MGTFLGGARCGSAFGSFMGTHRWNRARLALTGRCRTEQYNTVEESTHTATRPMQAGVQANKEEGAVVNTVTVMIFKNDKPDTVSDCRQAGRGYSKTFHPFAVAVPYYSAM